MSRHGPLKKPTMAQMPVLLFLADHPELYIVSCSLMNSVKQHFAYKNGKRYDGDDAPDIPKSLATYRWLQSGWIDKVSRGPSKNDDKDNPNNHWSWYDHPYAMTDEGREMAEKWRSAYEEHAAKQEAEKKKVERYIVISNTGRWSLSGEQRQYAALCKVVGETPKRIYVERVITDEEKSGHRYFSGYMSSIQGSTKQYVDRDVVTADGVTVAEYLAMRRAETRKIKWLSELKEQEDAEIAEIRSRYDLRREQNDAMFEDELREELQQVKKK